MIHTQTLEEATAIPLLPQRIAAWIAATVGSMGCSWPGSGSRADRVLGLAADARDWHPPGGRRHAAQHRVGGAGQATVLAIAGAAVGVTLAAVMASLLDSLLIGLRPIDPLAFALASTGHGGDVRRGMDPRPPRGHAGSGAVAQGGVNGEVLGFPVLGSRFWFCVHTLLLAGR